MNYRKTALGPGLYLVATPIGTARDITLRALDTLASCDLIAAEDTRTLRRLLEIHAIPLEGRRTVALHDHSDAGVIARLVDVMKEGASVACVSEAGSPLIADPGFELVRAARAVGVPVTAVPGPSAVVTALSVADLPTDRFLFCGFLPAASAARKAELMTLREVPATLVFYESPKRVREMLGDACEVLGKERAAAVCRELTKKFEEVRSGPLSRLVADFDGPAPKGEIVVLIDRPRTDGIAASDIEAALRQALTTMRVKEAVTTVSGALGLPRRQVYQTALDLTGKGKDDDARDA